jgi:phosphoribosylamine--glycine ligase
MENTDILVVGGGGREHAIVKKLSESPRCGKLYTAPGNAGIAELAECLRVAATDLDGIVAAARKLGVGCVFVAPDDPLAMGLVDRLNEAGIRAFGPTAAAAELEGSKVFAKGLMKKYGIPTATYEVFCDPEPALDYIVRTGKYPVVIKADGLALGKGAIIAQNQDEAEAALNFIMREKSFGRSGDRVVVEEYLTGPELTLLAFTDGETVSPMVSAQDHKRVFDGDRGPNTGGMGAFAPSRHYTPELAERCMREIFIPTVAALKAEGRVFKGVIYFQMMITADGPKVIEYNARFGDPEAQVVLPLMKTDLLNVMDAVIDGGLDRLQIEWDSRAAVCVCMASGGYPVKYEKGFPITGLDGINGDDIYVYHAGTVVKEGKIVTSGGRVLGVTALGKTVEDAAAKAYAAVAGIKFDGAHYRTDIGVKLHENKCTKPY